MSRTKWQKVSGRDLHGRLLYLDTNARALYFSLFVQSLRFCSSLIPTQEPIEGLDCPPYCHDLSREAYHTATRHLQACHFIVRKGDYWQLERYWEIVQPQRRPIDKATRDFIIKKEGGRCAYCKTDKADLHIDHLHPLCLGGSDDLENMVPACPTCNGKKSGRSVHAFLRDNPEILDEYWERLEEIEAAASDE